MKITEIEEYSLHGKSDGISHNGLKRDYEFFASVELADSNLITLHQLIDDSDPVIIGTVPNKEVSDREKIIFRLDFKKTITIKKLPEILLNKKILQVDSVFGDKKYRAQGLGAYVYSVLVKNGFVVISDSVQFEGGKNLWKSMARKANLANYKIYILDADNGFLEKDGKPIQYDGSNVDDAKIWTSGENYSGTNIVLVAA